MRRSRLSGQPDMVAGMPISGCAQAVKKKRISGDF
jgi:hypothetical protein